MPIRFRRYIKLAPGLRLNVGKKGLSLSAGVRGASMTLGHRGLHQNVGIPGTGLSYRRKIGDSSDEEEISPATTLQSSTVSAQFALDESGKVQFTDMQGLPLPPGMVKLVREQHGDALQSWLEKECDRWNQGIESILRLHLSTPAPESDPRFLLSPFEPTAPSKPRLKEPGLLAKLFKKKREQVAGENEELMTEHRQAVEEWQRAKTTHDNEQERKRWIHEEGRLEDPDVMHDYLAERLSLIAWPRETLVSFEIDSGGKAAFLDADFPEIEDMPLEQASIAARGLKLNIKDRKERQRRKEYATHLHAIAFRLVGESFSALPSVETVVLSGFSQRADRATGRIEDEYLLSVKVPRARWSNIDFSNLATLDPVACMERFELRRKMSTTGIFKAIDPFAPDKGS